MPNFLKYYSNLSVFLCVFSFLNLTWPTQDSLRFAAIGFCAVTAFRYGCFPAALFTVVSDFFLIFTPLYHWGIFFFSLVHLSYIRSLSMWGNNKPYLKVPLITAALLTLITPLETAGFLYACIFLYHIYFALQQKGNFNGYHFRLYLTALALFALCDITLAFNGPYPLIWLFYLPSQVLLSFTALGAADNPLFTTQGT